MIAEYKKIIIMSIIMLALIAGFVFILTTDIDLKVFKFLSVDGISSKRDEISLAEMEEKIAKINYEDAKTGLDAQKVGYEQAKKSFENIDKETIEMVAEATKVEKYFIEYLWVVLGNYATENSLMIDVITPGATSEKVETTDKDGNVISTPVKDTSVANNSVKIVVRGRYANVADFVYEVENDKELKFKLDNIKMVYVDNNAIEATFNVLSLQVSK